MLKPSNAGENENFGRVNEGAEAGLRWMKWD